MKSPYLLSGSILLIGMLGMLGTTALPTGPLSSFFGLMSGFGLLGLIYVWANRRKKR